MNAEPKVRVMLVEDSPTVRMLLCHIIDRDPRLQLAAVCVSAEEALDSIEQVRPDVISMDIRLPGMDGLEATRRIMSSVPTPIAPTAARQAGRAEGNIFAPSSGDRVAGTDDGFRQNKLSRKSRDFSCKTAVICGCDVGRGKGFRDAD